MAEIEIKRNIILIGLITIFSGILMVNAVSVNLERPSACSFCHSMEPYVSSYLEPQNGSTILAHRLECIDCHTNSSTGKVRETLIKKIEAAGIEFMTHTKLNVSTAAIAVNCTRCHMDDIPLHINSTMISRCQDCHWAHTPNITTRENIKRVAIIPSGPHINRTCSFCHGNNFRIPECIGCHKSHDSETRPENSVCLGCHLDPHIPEKIGVFPNYTKPFAEELPLETCKPCHINEYLEVSYSFSRHTEMQTCVRCHTSHGRIPGCEGCHKVMSEQRHPEFHCGNCHLTLNPALVTCFDCHGRNVHDLTASTAQWNPK